MIEKAPTEAMGGVMVPEIYLALWTKLRVLKGSRQNTYAKVLVGKF